jgi:hypothetical protein
LTPPLKGFGDMSPVVLYCLSNLKTKLSATLNL